MRIKDEEIFFVKYERDESKVIVYVPLRSYLGMYDKRIIDFLQSDDNAISRAFFDNLEKYELVDIHAAHKMAQSIIPELTLPITNNCNLRCEYCYLRAGDEDVKQVMTNEEIRSIVDAYFEAIDDYPIHLKDNKISISIAGGGEPTAEFQSFKFAILYMEEKCKEKGLEPLFHMPTNGAHGIRVREFILDHFAEISFSIDGPSFVQNYQRPFKNGSPSFNVVYESAKFYYEHGLKMAFRMTVTDYNVKFLKEILEFFDTEFKGVTVGIEAMNVFGRAINNQKVSPPEPHEFTNALIDAYQFASKRKMSILNASDSKFHSLRTFFCGAVGIPNWTVTCDGRITSCTRDNMPDDFTFGRFDRETQKLIIDKEKIRPVRLV